LQREREELWSNGDVQLTSYALNFNP